MKIKYYLKRPSVKKNSDKTEVASKPTAIFALINYDGHSIKYYIGESISPKFWNKKANEVKATPSFPEYPEFNQRLASIKAAINKSYLDYKNSHNHVTPAPEVLLPLIERALNKNIVDTTLFSFFEGFRDSLKDGKKINPKTKKPVKGTGHKGYNTTLTHLKEFSKTWKRKVGFETIDLEFYDDFMKYLTGQNMTVNTKGSHIQRIKAVMRDAYEKGLTKNEAFKKRGFVRVEEQTDTIYLSESELQEIEDLDLTESPRLDVVRDLFLIGCYTGLRVSDYSTLNKSNLSNGFIKIKATVKTQAPVTIPVHSVVKRILDKYDGHPPTRVSDVELNRCIKQVGSKIDSLKILVDITEIEGGLKILKKKEKYNLISSHTARRSFATNEYLAGTPSITIMAITGHKTEKSFLRYIRVTPEEHAVILMKLWADRESRRNNLRAV